MSCHIFYVSHLPSSWRCHLIIFLADSTKFSLVPGGREICCRGGVKKIWNQVQRQTQIGLVQITTCEQLKKKKNKKYERCWLKIRDGGLGDSMSVRICLPI